MRQSKQKIAECKAHSSEEQTTDNAPQLPVITFSGALQAQPACIVISLEVERRRRQHHEQPQMRSSAEADAKPSPLAETIAALLRNGYTPILLEPRSKKPIAKGWEKGTPTADKLLHQLQETPNANLGIRCGDNDLLNIDIDSDELLERLRPHLPAGAPIKVGKRGAGVLVRCPGIATEKIKDTKGEFALELRGRGTQVVIPPSVHPDTGLPYRWGGAETVLNTAAAELPLVSRQTLKELAWIAGTTSYGEAALREECALVATTPDGNRNQQLFTSALKVFALVKSKDITGDTAFDALTAAAEAAGLDDAEITDTLKSAAERAQARPNENAERAKKQGAAPALGLEVARVADIKARPVEWLWRGRLARGKQTLIGGEPGAGKSQVACALVAALTTGGDWPCGEGKAPLGRTIILAAEDGAADTLKPRLVAAGADVSRVHIVNAARTGDGQQRPINLKTDLAALEHLVKALGDVALIVIDPVTAYMGDVDGRKNTSVRAILDPVAQMADRARVAVLSITHFRKEGGGERTREALHRFLDSVGFTAVARVCLALLKDPENSDRRLLLPAKNNLTKDPSGLALSFRDAAIEVDGEHIETSCVRWEPAHVEITANEALVAAERSAELGETRRLILDVLFEEPEGMTPTKITEATGAKSNTIKSTLRRMVQRSQVHAKDGVYWHPDHVAPLVPAAFGGRESR